MKLVIDIDDNIYTRLFDNGVDDPDDPIDDPIDIATVINDTIDIQTAIRNGTPLPEHHGRLIDADAMQKYQIDTFGQRLLVIDTAPTIIEGSDSKCHIV